MVRKDTSRPVSIDPQPAAVREAKFRRWVVPALCAVAIIAWLVPLRSSLWLDETGTYWIIKDGLGKAIERSWRFQGQSPLYYLIELGTFRLFGGSELVLRMPSVLFLLGALVFLYRLTGRLFDSETGWLAVLTFAVAGQIRFIAADARPYALGLLALTACTFFLVRWIEEGRSVDGIWYVVSASAMLYAHYVLGPALMGHLVLALLFRRRFPRALHRLIWGYGATAVICLPLLWQLSTLWRRGPQLSWVIGDGTVGFALMLILPLLVVAGGTLLRRMSPQGGPENSGRDVLVFLLAWSIAPPVAIYAISRFSSMNLFHARYLVVVAPATAVLLAWAIRGVSISWMRLVVAAAAVIVSLSTLSFEHRNEPWRDAIRTANRTIGGSARASLLLTSGFVEGRDTSSLTDAERAGFLVAPVAYYPVRARVAPLPYGSGEDLERVATEIAIRESEGASLLVLIANYGNPFQASIDDALSPRGFRTRIVGFFGTMVVVAFERSRTIPRG